jgi:hypothetical protein
MVEVAKAIGMAMTMAMVIAAPTVITTTMTAEAHTHTVTRQLRVMQGTEGMLLSRPAGMGAHMGPVALATTVKKATAMKAVAIHPTIRKMKTLHPIAVENTVMARDPMTMEITVLATAVEAAILPPTAVDVVILPPTAVEVVNLPPTVVEVVLLVEIVVVVVSVPPRLRLRLALAVVMLVVLVNAFDLTLCGVVGTVSTLCMSSFALLDIGIPDDALLEIFSLELSICCYR